MTERCWDINFYQILELAQTGDKLAESLLEYSALYPQSPLGEALVRTAETEQALSSLRHAYVSFSSIG